MSGEHKHRTGYVWIDARGVDPLNGWVDYSSALISGAPACRRTKVLHRISPTLKVAPTLEALAAVTFQVCRRLQWPYTVFALDGPGRGSDYLALHHDYVEQWSRIKPARVDKQVPLSDLFGPNGANVLALFDTLIAAAPATRSEMRAFHPSRNVGVESTRSYEDLADALRAMRTAADRHDLTYRAMLASAVAEELVIGSDRPRRPHPRGITGTLFGNTAAATVVRQHMSGPRYAKAAEGLSRLPSYDTTEAATAARRRGRLRRPVW